MTGLDTFSTEELVTELYARYDCVVFAGLRDLCVQNQETECGFAGGATTAKGLCGDLLDYIREHQRHARLDEGPLESWEDDE
jgi:hypothetical protein